MNSIRLERLFEFLKDEPNDPFLLYAIALEYNEAEPHKALEYFNILLKDHENYTGTYYHAAKLHEKLGNIDEALKTYEKGILICRKNNDTHALSELMRAYNSFRNEEEEEDW